MTLEEIEVSRIAYFRVSTRDQSIEAQRAALRGPFDREFADVAVSGASIAAERPGFAQMLNYVREGDILYVYAVDRLGRDALDVQTNVRALMTKGVVVNILGLGPIGKGVGELIVAVLAQMAQMERDRIRERCDAGRVVARTTLAVTGLTHRGKRGLGRQPIHDAAVVREWRERAGSSLSATAAHFGISLATAKRYCRRDAPMPGPETDDRRPGN